MSIGILLHDVIHWEYLCYYNKWKSSLVVPACSIVNYFKIADDAQCASTFAELSIVIHMLCKISQLFLGHEFKSNWRLFVTGSMRPVISQAVFADSLQTPLKLPINWF